MKLQTHGSTAWISSICGLFSSSHNPKNLMSKSIFCAFAQLNSQLLEYVVSSEAQIGKYSRVQKQLLPADPTEAEFVGCMTKAAMPMTAIILFKPIFVVVMLFFVDIVESVENSRKFLIFVVIELFASISLIELMMSVVCCYLLYEILGLLSRSKVTRNSYQALSRVF